MAIYSDPPPNRTNLGWRWQGLYPEQIQRWRASCEQANDAADAAASREAENSKVERKRNRELEQELERKETALAETAALLTLLKKVLRRSAW